MNCLKFHLKKKIIENLDAKVSTGFHFIQYSLLKIVRIICEHIFYFIKTTASGTRIFSLNRWLKNIFISQIQNILNFYQLTKSDNMNQQKYTIKVRSKKIKLMKKRESTFIKGNVSSV
jgi:hypothetical protein